MKYSTEVIRRVYDDKEGVCIEVGPDRDAVGLIEIRTTDPESKKWFGDIGVMFNAEMARRVGEALVLAASEAEQEPSNE